MVLDSTSLLTMVVRAATAARPEIFVETEYP
jgi:hypothetical protein